MTAGAWSRSPAADPAAIAERWRVRCLRDEGGARGVWPAAESQALVVEVVQAAASPTGGVPTELDSATRAWARACPSISVLVLRLAGLRHLLAEEGPSLFPHGAAAIADLLDAVTIVANEQAGAVLERAALTDPLTGAGNRRALVRAAAAAFAHAARARVPVCVVVIDIDGLKQTNDTGGHEAGDRAIAGLASGLREAIRDTDQLFRVGGDEFVVLVPGASSAYAAPIMERARALGVPAFSWGAADTGDAQTLDEILAAADARLYESRRAARGSAAPARPAAGGRRERGDRRGMGEAAARLAWRRRPAELLGAAIAAIVVGILVLTLTGPGTLTCGGSACASVDVLRTFAIVAIVLGGLLLLGAGAAVVLRRDRVR